MERVDDAKVLYAPRGRCPLCDHRMFHIWSVKVGGDPGTQLWRCFHCGCLWFVRELEGIFRQRLIGGQGEAGVIVLD